MSLGDIATGIFWLGMGAGLGMCYYWLLAYTVRMYTEDVPAGRMIFSYLIRIAAAVLGFWLGARQGALPLLLMLSGFVLARSVVQRHVGRIV